jgi:hypothetical protein
MQNRLALSLLVALSAVPVFADDVYLANGRKFEGVIAETTDSEVRIQMQGGVLSLPLTQVARVEKGESSLAEYLRRKEALQRDPRALASHWLDLARWAQTQKLQHGTREAALRAAELDPRLSGLSPILRGVGYVYDDQLDRWIPYADSMRRRGFVQANGHWITRQEQEAAIRAQEEEAERRRAFREDAARSAREDRLAALTELALVQEVTRSERHSSGIPLLVSPGYFFPPLFVDPPHDPDFPGHHGRSGFGPHAGSPRSVTRVPGSLIRGHR